MQVVVPERMGEIGIGQPQRIDEALKVLMLGSGAVIVMDDTRQMPESLRRLSYFYMHESCGQCTPCREGTGWLWRVVDRICNGHGKQSDLDLLDSVADNIQGRTICALGDAAAMPVRAMLKHFRHEFAARIQRPELPASDGQQPVPAGARG